MKWLSFLLILLIQKNSLDRYKAVISVDTEKLNELVKVSTQNKTRQRLSQCDAVICMISAYDANVSWIECTFCQAWGSPNM